MIFYKILRPIYRFFRPVISNGTNNIISRNSKLGTNFTISIYGSSNTIEIGSGCDLKNTIITILGENNHLKIGNSVRFMGPSRITLENGATLSIGDNTRIRGVQFVLKEGKVCVGSDCMTSYNVLIRNHDSHKIYYADHLEKQINNPKDIIIGDHVWLCQNASVLKGAVIGSDSIVGFGAIVTKGCAPNSILAGNPASVVKEGITWRV